MLKLLQKQHQSEDHVREKGHRENVLTIDPQRDRLAHVLLQLGVEGLAGVGEPVVGCRQAERQLVDHFGA